MYTKLTIIGIIAGGIIASIGVIALLMSFGIQTIQVDDTLDVGEGETYSLNAPVHTEQLMNVTGSTFDIYLTSPPGGLQIPNTPHKDHVSLQWIHLKDGPSTLKIQNTGSSELKVIGIVNVTSDPILSTYHIMVIIAGLVIIGFSAGFSTRKPKGF